jgi:hypothetical protein
LIDARFVLLGAVFNLAGTQSYLRATLKGEVRPNRVTWILWSVIPLMAFSAEVSSGVGLPALMTLMVGVGPLLVLLASFIGRKSAWQLTGLDLVCGGLSVAGLIAWQVSGTSNLAIIFSIAADALAAMPTIAKSLREPASENCQIYFYSAASALITLLTIKTWDLSNCGFPLYILFVATLIGILVKFEIGTGLRWARDSVKLTPGRMGLKRQHSGHAE